MRKPSPTAPNDLPKSVAAWNHKASATSGPVLQHIFTVIRNLQQLRAGIRQIGPLDLLAVAALDASEKAGALPESADALRALVVRLDEIEQALAELSERAHAVSEQGESLIRDYLALPVHTECGSAGAVVNDGCATAPWAEGRAESIADADVRALDRLIEVQKAEIESLNQQLSEAEHWLAQPGEPAPDSPPRVWGQIELQSLQEFMQHSPIASIPINASYYERILEAASSPEGHKVPMGQILTSAGVVTERQLESALGYQREGRRQALGGLLVDLGYTTEDAIAQALAAQLALPYVVLSREPVDPAAVSIIPAHMLRRHGAFPLRFQGHALCVAMANPLDLIALEDLRLASNKHIRPCVAARSEISGLIERFCV